MPIRPGEYHRPADWASARQLLRRAEVRTAPLVVGPRVPIPPYADAEAVVDLSRLDLSYIKVDDGVHIGALTPLQDLADSPQLEAIAHGLLSKAARLTAHYGLRHLATVGGALLARPGPPEVGLALLALEAVVIIRGEATREVSLVDFSADNLQAGEVMAEVRFASTTGAGGALERVARTRRDEAIVAAAAVVEMTNGNCRKARLALAAPRPQRMPAAERMLEGQPVTNDQLQNIADVVTSEAQVSADFRASAEYRQAMAGVLARRALETAWKRAQE